MAKLHINIGDTANDRTGDPLRIAFEKVNANFDELYGLDNTAEIFHLGDDVQFVDIDPDTGMVVIQSGFDTGMPVYIKGANCSDEGVGGNVIIEAGGAPLPNNGTTGNIELAAQQTTIESNNNMWSFRDDGVLELPVGGFIADSDGNNILDGLGGSGVSISDFGEGFSLNGADKIVTNKLYSTNETQSTQHYRLTLDTNGVVHLPDESIINGATLKTVSGGWAGITAGPVGHDEDSWVFVDNDGAWIATKYSTDAFTWHFDNSGNLTLPAGGTINNQSGGAGTIYTFVNDGESTPGIAGDTVVYLPNNLNAQATQSGWIITFADATQKTVLVSDTGMPPHAAQRMLTFTGAVTKTGSEVWPLTVQSADYSAGGATSLELTPDGTTTWTFGADGKLKLPNPDSGEAIITSDYGTTLLSSDQAALHFYNGPTESDPNRVNEAWVFASRFGVQIQMYNDSHAGGDYLGWSFKPDGKLQLPVGGTVSYTPTTASDWNGTAPTTIQEAIDRLAALVKTLNTGTGA
jgi:hypothetical protein